VHKWKLYISQVSAATRVGCAVWQWKNFQKWLIFG